MKYTHCQLCFSDISKKQTIYDFIKQDSILCGECKAQLKLIHQSTTLGKMKLTMLYEYNDFLENMIYQFKEGRDVALKNVFFHDFIKEINDKYRHYTIVLMPSSETKIKERGFIPVQEMLANVKLPIIQPFYKLLNHKQSLQSYENRAYISQVIKRNFNVKIPKTKLLLIDDVCTSGSTLQCAYNLLAQHTYKIEALVLCAHPRFVESCDRKGLKKHRSISILKTMVTR